MTKNTPSGAKKHRESTEPESHQTAKMFFFLLLLLLHSEDKTIGVDNAMIKTVCLSIIVNYKQEPGSILLKGTQK